MGTWNKFKKTALYYWLVLVLWQSIIEISSVSFVRDKIMDYLFTVLVWIAISVLLAYGLIQTELAQTLGVPTDLKSYIPVIVILIMARILQNILVIAPRLYFESRRKQDRHSWDDIYVEKKVFKLKGKIRGYGICVRSDKPFAYDVLVQMPYFEVDGYAHQDDSELATLGKGRRLKWVENPNPHAAAPAHLFEDTREATFYLFDTDSDNGVYSISCWEKVENRDEMLPQFRKIESYCRGELNIHLKDSDGTAAQEYNFDMSIDFWGNAKMKIQKGRISSYKPPILTQSEE